MAKSKTLVISGPMDAKHVGGISVMGGKESSILDSYFNRIVSEPDETPSHTYSTTGSKKAPKRSDTVAGTIRRPSLLLRRNFTTLRRKSISHMSEVHIPAGPESNSNANVSQSESARPLRMQSSLSRLRQRVGLDRELDEPAPVPNAVATEQEPTPRPIEKDGSSLQLRKPLPRAPSYSSSRYPETQWQTTSTPTQRKPSNTRQNSSSVPQRPSPASHEHVIVPLAPDRPALPRRVDSGTAITLDMVPAPQRPLPFQDIMAVRSFAERMKMYKRTRDYWAYADHGLIDWTGRASGPRVALYGTQTVA